MASLNLLGGFYPYQLKRGVPNPNAEANCDEYDKNRYVARQSPLGQPATLVTVRTLFNPKIFISPTHTPTLPPRTRMASLKLLGGFNL